MQKQLEYLKKIHFTFYLLVFDEKRIKKTINLFNIMINLIFEWSCIDTNSVTNGKYKNYAPSILLSYIPEDYLTMIYEFHVFYLKRHDNYITLMNAEQVRIFLYQYF